MECQRAEQAAYSNIGRTLASYTLVVGEIRSLFDLQG